MKSQIRTILFACILTAGSAHASTVSYTLHNIFLDNGTHLTGSFDWDYTVGDFEGGSGTYTELDIPVQPIGSTPPLEDPNMVLTIENKQIEISLNGNFHDYGLDIIMKFVQPLSPTQSSSIDLNTSFYECCGNGFQNHSFISGSISPVISAVPLPAAVWLYASALIGLLGLARRNDNWGVRPVLQVKF